MNHIKGFASQHRHQLTQEKRVAPVAIHIDREDLHTRRKARGHDRVDDDRHLVSQREGIGQFHHMALKTALAPAGQ